MPLCTVLSGITFVLYLFFYTYSTGSFFRITVYPFVNRVTFYSLFQEHIVNGYLDNIVVIIVTSLWFLFSIRNRRIRYYFSAIYGSTGLVAILSANDRILGIIALLSLPLVISVLLYYRQQKKALNFDSKLILRYISVGAIAASAISIAFLVSSFFLSPHSDSLARYSPANEIFLLLSSFSSIYLVLLVFCLPVKVLFKEALRVLKLHVKEDLGQEIFYGGQQSKLKTRTKAGFLLFAILLSIILVLIPQHPIMNQDNQDIGVDTHYYVTWVGELEKSNSLYDFLYQAFVIRGIHGDRPFSLISIFLVHQVAGGNLSDIIEHLPLILGPGIVLSFYFLTLELVKNEKIALLGAFLAAVSLHTLAGIYAGFYANWLALIVGYISIVFLFRYLRSNRISNILVFAILLIAVLFFHVYTWTVLTAVAGIFLIAMLRVVVKRKRNNKNNDNNYYTKKAIVWLLVVMILSVVIDVAKVMLTGSSGGLEQDIGLAQRSLGIEQFNMRWIILDTTMHHSFGGVFSNFIILALGLFWLLKSNMHEPSNIFLMIFFSAGLIPLFFGDWIIQARVFYDMPFEIPASIALYYISKRAGSTLVTITTCSWMVSVSLFTVMNYYLIPMPGFQ
ncbi:MAG: hypothetical protein M3247_06330 [Thermoproteota archaeon]|nr:hypothetical protein [Thermoproteota archaeon]